MTTPQPDGSSKTSEEEFERLAQNLYHQMDDKPKWDALYAAAAYVLTHYTRNEVVVAELSRIEREARIDEKDQHRRSVETLRLSGHGDTEIVAQIERLLLKQAKLLLASRDLRSPNKYEVLPEFVALIASELVKAREDMTKLLEWATGDYDGVSSQAILRHMCGLQANHWGFMPPSDRSDRGRCIRLLNLMPEWWNRLDEMTKYHGWADQIPLIRNEGEHLTANKTKEAGNGS